MTSPTSPRTPRLVLTPVGPDDVDDLVLLYADPQVALWTGSSTSAAATSWAADMTARWTADGVGKWMARYRADGSLVGHGGFTRIHVDGEKVPGLGWVVRDARTGHGHATELGRAALVWAPSSTRACRSSPSQRCTTTLPSRRAGDAELVDDIVETRRPTPCSCTQRGSATMGRLWPTSSTTFAGWSPLARSALRIARGEPPNYARPGFQPRAGGRRCASHNRLPRLSPSAYELMTGTQRPT
jgi:hypothetical protein